MDSISKDPDEWITLLESYKTQTNKVKIPGKTDMSKVDLIIPNLASLPKKYEVAVIVLEDCLMITTQSAQLDIETVCEKISLRHDRVKQHEQNESDDHDLAPFQKQYKGRYS